MTYTLWTVRKRVLCVYWWLRKKRRKSKWTKQGWFSVLPVSLTGSPASHSSSRLYIFYTVPRKTKGERGKETFFAFKELILKNKLAREWLSGKTLFSAVIWRARLLLWCLWLSPCPLAPWGLSKACVFRKLPDKEGSEIPTFVGFQSALEHSWSFFFFFKQDSIWFSPLVSKQCRSLEDTKYLLGPGTLALVAPGGCVGMRRHLRTGRSSSWWGLVLSYRWGWSESTWATAVAKAWSGGLAVVRGGEGPRAVWATAAPSLRLQVFL